MSRAALFFTLAILSAAPAQAQTLGAQAGADALSRRCAAAGGTPREGAGLVRTVELGGRAAAALDAQRFGCAGAPPVDCGPFGCKLSIYFGGPVAVFETYVKAWRARAGKLEIMRVGAYCAGTGESCSETYQVAGEGLALAGRGEAKFATEPAPKPGARPVAARAPAAKPARHAARHAGRQAGRQAGSDERTAQEKRMGAGRASTRGAFDGAEAPTPAAPRTQPAPAASVSTPPGVVAERRRKLDAAPYVP